MTAQFVTKTQQKTVTLSLVVYFVGLILGVSVAILAIWGDLEASLFDTLFQAEQRLPTLSCPILVTPDEDITIQASFTNRGDRDENLSVRARISQGFASLIREERIEFTLAPGESETAVFPVSADDAAWDRVVMARISTVRNAPYRQLVGSSCGILLLPFPIQGVTGGQIVTGMLVASLLFTLLGGFFWQNGRSRPFPPHVRKVWRLMLVFAGLVTAALILSLLQFWLFGGMLLIILFLLVISATDSFSDAPLNRAQ